MGTPKQTFAKSIAFWARIAETAQRKADAASGAEKARFEAQADSARKVADAMKNIAGRSERAPLSGMRY